MKNIIYRGGFTIINIGIVIFKKLDNNDFFHKEDNPDCMNKS
jgi:hypothetical protein